MELNCLRGFKDVILTDAKKFNYIIDLIGKVAETYNYQKSYFPILEESSVYQRTLGEASDIVNKEMYNFTDKGENKVTLRPEFTAGIVRSLISNKLYHELPLKFFTYGPLFRYERPQKARQRQFNQVNFEFFGNDTYFAELELIMLIEQIIKKLNIQNKVTLEINSLGSNDARLKYKDELVNYYLRYENDLSEDSKHRLKTNPLRILDSKDIKDQEINQDAPLLEDYFTSFDQKFFSSLLEELTKQNISYKLNNKLVRGLDYYAHTVFEYSTALLGAQNAVFAGGRYDNLIENMGGRATPAVGFAGGVERMFELIEMNEQNIINIIVLPLSDAEKSSAFSLLNLLRQNDIKADIIFSGGNLTKKLKKAAKFKPDFVAILGENEVATKQVLLRNFKSGKEVLCEFANLAADFFAFKEKF